LSNVNILTSSNPTNLNSDSILVQAEVTPIDHRCVACRSSASLRFSFLTWATVEGDNTIQRRGCQEHQQGQKNLLLIL
jgi:hypothetical protein